MSTNSADSMPDDPLQQFLWHLSKALESANKAAPMQDSNLKKFLETQGNTELSDIKTVLIDCQNAIEEDLEDRAEAEGRQGDPYDLETEAAHQRYDYSMAAMGAAL
jgi:hypothetical protein